VTNCVSSIQHISIITSGPPLAVAYLLIFFVSSTATLWLTSIPQAANFEPSGEKLKHAIPFLRTPLKEYFIL